MLRTHTIRYFCAITLITLPQHTFTKNLPIVLVHGIFSDKHAMIPVEKHIQQHIPNVYVKNIQLGLGKLTSFFNMYDQTRWLKEELESDENLQDGCIMIAHSQGGLVARHFIEQYNNPRVYVYISWGSPQAGIFGSPGGWDNEPGWLRYIEDFSYSVIYSYLMQRLVSFAGYWKDPLHYDEYLQKSTFLPYLNNEIEHANSELFKRNMCSLESMVIVQSTQEDVVDPAVSSHFGFYHIGSSEKICSLFDSEWYQEDKLGLKTLADSGRLHLEFAECSHTNFQADEYNFIANTLPYLIHPV